MRHVGEVLESNRAEPTYGQPARQICTPIEAAREPERRTGSMRPVMELARRLRASVGLCGFADGTIQPQSLLPCKCRWA